MKTFSKLPNEINFETVKCALCGSTENSNLWKGSIPFVRCSNCSLVFQNPQPRFNELSQRYDDEYFDYEIENEDVFFNLMELGLSDVGFFEEEERILKTCKELNEKPVFLDVGCATGMLLQSMRERGWAVKGVEICRQSAEYGIKQRKLDIHCGPVDTAALSEASIDVVHCSHLIEHLTDPAGFIAEISRILKPGGLFIIVTPDISGFQARLFGEGWRSAIADHMYLFSGKTLRKLMENKGFRIIRTASWGGLAAGTAPKLIKKAADKIVKSIGQGDVICIMGSN